MLFPFLAQTRKFSHTVTHTQIYNFELAFSVLFIQSENNIYLKDLCQIQEAAGHFHVGMEELIKRYMRGSWINITQTTFYQSLVN